LSASLTPYEFGNLVAHLLAAGRVDDAERLLGLETDESANWWHEARDSRAQLDLLPRLAAQRRSDFLTDLGALLPCLVGHDAAATDRLATSVIEAGRWWR
jgi:hypothetical protein